MKLKKQNQSKFTLPIAFMLMAAMVLSSCTANYQESIGMPSKHGIIESGDWDLGISELTQVKNDISGCILAKDKTLTKKLSLYFNHFSGRIIDGEKYIEINGINYFKPHEEVVDDIKSGSLPMIDDGDQYLFRYNYDKKKCDWFLKTDGPASKTYNYND